MVDRKLNLIGIIVLGLVVLLVFLNIKKAPSEGNVEGKRLMPSLSQRANDIQGIEFIQGESSVFFKRIGSAWVDTSRGNYPIKFERVKEHLVALSSIRGAQALTSDPKRYEALSLSWPDVNSDSRLVRLYLNPNDPPVSEIVLGREKWNPQSVYVRLIGESQCWRADNRIPFELNGARWMDRTVSSIATSDIRSVSVGPLSIYREDSSKEWEVEIIEKDIDISDDKIQTAKTTFPSLLNRLEFEDVRLAGDQLSGLPDVIITYTLDNGSIIFEGYEEQESYWFRLKTDIDLNNEIQEDSSDESELWINEAKEWGNWEYQMSSWRSNQIKEFFIAEDQADTE